MSKRTILFVVRDIGGTNVIFPTAEQFRAMDDFQVVIVCESGGMAATRAAKERVPFISMDLNMELCRELISVQRPDVVAAGCGNPMGLELLIAVAANEAGIPVVAVEDTWAAATRLTKTVGGHGPAQIDLALVVDGASEEICNEVHPRAEAIVAGNPGAKVIEPREAAKNFVSGLHEKYPDGVFLFVGGGASYVTEVIQLLLECLANTKGRCCVIKTYHPKMAKEVMEDGEPYYDHWDQLFQTSAMQVVELSEEGVSTDEMACLVDLVLTCFSTVGPTAIFNGVPAVILDTPNTNDALFEQIGSRFYPMSVLGLADKVSKTKNLATFCSPPDMERVRRVLKPFDPDVAVKAIRDMLV